MKSRRFCLGEDFIQFFAALAILPRTILNNRMNLSFSYKSSERHSSYNSNRSVLNSLHSKELNKFSPKTAATNFAFSSVFILLLWARFKVSTKDLLNTYSLGKCNIFLLLRTHSSTKKVVGGFYAVGWGKANRGKDGGDYPPPSSQPPIIPYRRIWEMGG